MKMRCELLLRRYVTIGETLYKISKLKKCNIDVIRYTKPFKCQVEGCEYSAALAETLTIHMCGHTGDRPFKCKFKECDYATTNSGALVIHKRRVHTGEKPFKCKIEGCEFAAASCGPLKRHVITHEKYNKMMLLTLL
jgi:uncharacterized Zn-finger protein